MDTVQPNLSKKLTLLVKYLDVNITLQWDILWITFEKSPQKTYQENICQNDSTQNRCLSFWCHQWNLELCIQMFISFLFSLLFASLLFTAICKPHVNRQLAGSSIVDLNLSWHMFIYIVFSSVCFTPRALSRSEQSGSYLTPIKLWASLAFMFLRLIGLSSLFPNVNKPLSLIVFEMRLNDSILTWNWGDWKGIFHLSGRSKHPYSYFFLLF